MINKILYILILPVSILKAKEEDNTLFPGSLMVQDAVSTTLKLEKEVLGYEIITRERTDWVKYNVPFRVLYPENMDRSSKDYKLSCHVEYEFLLAPVFAYNRQTNTDNQTQVGGIGL